MEANASRAVETFDELAGRGLSTLEALAFWLRDREGRAELRYAIGDLYLCTVHTRWHVLAVPGKTLELAIAHACRRVDELLQRDFAHLQSPPEPESAEAESSEPLGPKGRS